MQNILAVLGREFRDKDGGKQIWCSICYATRSNVQAPTHIRPNPRSLHYLRFPICSFRERQENSIQSSKKKPYSALRLLAYSSLRSKHLEEHYQLIFAERNGQILTYDVEHDTTGMRFLGTNYGILQALRVSFGLE